MTISGALWPSGLVGAMARLGIREEDLEEQFIRAAGPGGQHVNKAATCVILRHRPTGIQVRCQQERSQAMNRVLARQRLVEQITAQLQARERALGQAAAKRRARARRRSTGGQTPAPLAHGSRV